MVTLHRLLLLPLLFCLTCGSTVAALDVLFLGDNGHHRPRERFAELQQVLLGRGIHMMYTDQMSDLTGEKLSKYAALVVYANIDRIEASEEAALLEYVSGGGGFVPLHCATYCFRNSDKVVALMGAQFRRHGTGVFRTELASENHPITKGFGGFESWDETYVHHLHNDQNRTILEYRVDEEGREPWTWVRTHGKGRVFYTAWGHDHRTWSNPGFRNLVERGIRWAAGEDPQESHSYLGDQGFAVPEMTPPRTDKEPFDYLDVGAKIPNYPPSERWGVQEEPLTKMQKPLEPEESIKHFVTPANFTVSLYASEPDLGGKPIAMNWDEQGRLWVCESYDYPNELQPAGKGRDRIRICEDTDGDGKADQFTVFAEQLSIPTAITFYRGGAIVQNGVETLYLKDTDGDGMSDVRKVLISNWALGDTHGGVSNFRYGHDNWFWAMQGYNNSAPTIEGAEQQSFRMGFFRFKLDNNDPPTVTELEFIRSTNNNTWGLGLTEEGIVVGSTANRNPSVYMPIANQYYEGVRGWAPERLETMADNHLFEPITGAVRQVDQHGGYTAGAGHAVYTARTYPRQWWNKTAFVCGPTGHLVGTFVMRREGADMFSQSPCNLLASTDEWTAPIAAEIGPDGNVWVLDWYNYIVQHNPTPRGFERGKGNAYETDLRDKKFGRIYRVCYDGNPEAQEWKALDSEPSVRLVRALRHPNMTWRLHAQRLLVERQDQNMAPHLALLTRDTSVDEIGLNVGAIHAIWTLQGLGLLNSDLGAQALEAAMHHPSAGVRRAACQACVANADTLETKNVKRLARLLSERIFDPDPQVQLAATLATARIQADDLGSTLATVFVGGSFSNDRWLMDALTAAASRQSLSFLNALSNESEDAASISEPMEELLERVAEHIARGRPTAEEVGRVVSSAAAVPAQLADAIVRGMSDGWPDQHKVRISAATEKTLGNVFDQVGSGAKGQLVRLSLNWGSREFEERSAEIVASLTQTLLDDEADEASRSESARQLVSLRPDEPAVVAQVLELVTPQITPELATGLLDAVGTSQTPELGRIMLDHYEAFTPATQSAAVTMLLRRSDTTSSLLDGVQSGKMPLTDLKLDQKQALGAHPDASIRDRARKLMEASGVLPNPDRQIVLEELISVTHQEGDVANGAKVFKQHCSKCHVYKDVGEQIGPNLTGMSVHPKEELLTHIVDPSRSVEGNFRQYTVVTLDGQVINGMLAAETKTAIELIDTDAKRHPVPRADIEQFVGSKKSVMPEGFEKQISKDAFADLLEFLTDKGKFVPIPLHRIATAISTKGLFHHGDNGADRIVFDDWGGKTFAGVPFQLVDPRQKSTPNIVLLYGPQGTLPPSMPKSVELEVNMPLKSIHLLSGVSGWGFPAHGSKSVSMIVRFRYEDGETEDHPLRNGEHFADYIRRFDVPRSQFAFGVRGQQVRYLAVSPERDAPVKKIELVKGDDDPTAPIVVAVTLESI